MRPNCIFYSRSCVYVCTPDRKQAGNSPKRRFLAARDSDWIGIRENALVSMRCEFHCFLPSCMLKTSTFFMLRVWNWVLKLSVFVRSFRLYRWDSCYLFKLFSDTIYQYKYYFKSRSTLLPRFRFSRVGTKSRQKLEVLPVAIFSVAQRWLQEARHYFFWPGPKAVVRKWRPSTFISRINSPDTNADRQNRVFQVPTLLHSRGTTNGHLESLKLKNRHRRRTYPWILYVRFLFLNLCTVRFGIVSDKRFNVCKWYFIYIFSERKRLKILNLIFNIYLLKVKDVYVWWNGKFNRDTFD